MTEDEEQPDTSSATAMEVSYDSFIVFTESRNYCAMKVASADVSYRSCEGISSIFVLYSVVEFLSLKLSRSYVISDGLYDPSFRKANLWYLKQETSETTTA